MATFCRSLALVVLLATIASCNGEDSPDANGATTTTGEGATTTMGEGATTTGEGATTTTGGGGGTTTPDGGDQAQFNLIASPDNGSCNYIPNGHLSGADQLTVHFFFLIILGNPQDVGFLSVQGASDTGLSTSYNSAPNNQAQSTAQFALRPGDFGRSHTLTITVDSANQVRETDEADNRIRVTVRLPSPRPNRTIDPLPCSISRG